MCRLKRSLPASRCIGKCWRGYRATGQRGQRAAQSVCGLAHGWRHGGVYPRIGRANADDLGAGGGGVLMPSVEYLLAVRGNGVVHGIGVTKAQPEPQARIGAEVV